MEAELVAVDNALPHLVWTRYFMIAQGYDIKDIILYQDNLSAMLRTTKGKASNGKRIRIIFGAPILSLSRAYVGYIHFKIFYTTTYVGKNQTKINTFYHQKSAIQLNLISTAINTTSDPLTIHTHLRLLFIGIEARSPTEF